MEQTLRTYFRLSNDQVTELAFKQKLKEEVQYALTKQLVDTLMSSGYIDYASEKTPIDTLQHETGVLFKAELTILTKDT